MISPVQLWTEHRGSTTIMRISGEPDLTNVRDLEYQIHEAISNATVAVVVDLSQVRYLDSAGLNMLFILHRKLKDRGQRISLVVPERALIRPLLKMVQMNNAIDIYSSLDDALNGVG